ncbi:MAG: polysaccharide deacetylase family protein [bacterium]
MSPVVATLSYHKIGTPPSSGWQTWNYTSQDEFSGHLEWFHKRDWKFLSASELLNGLNGPGELPERGVLVSFDDAYESILENSLPILQRFDAPAVVFVPTQFVGGTNLFDHGIEPVERIADWGLLASMETAGYSIESHGASHRSFSSLSATEIENELRISREAIRMNLAKESRLFAFPYGDVGRDREALNSFLKDAGYEVAFLYGGGCFHCDPKPSPVFLPRLAMGPGVDLDEMLSNLQPG